MPTQKKKYTTVAQRVDKTICDKVKEALVGQETIGGFYDRAAQEKLDREGIPTLERQTFPVKKETK
jgi:hypothetical protein